MVSVQEEMKSRQVGQRGLGFSLLPTGWDPSVHYAIDQYGRVVIKVISDAQY